MYYNFIVSNICHHREDNQICVASQEYKIGYLFLMGREFQELLRHEELMNPIAEQNKVPPVRL